MVLNLNIVLINISCFLFALFPEVAFMNSSFFLSLVSCFVRFGVKTCDFLNENSHFQLGDNARSSWQKVFKTFIEVVFCVVWFLSHLGKSGLNERFCLIKVKSTVTIIIELIPNVLNNRVNNMVYIFILLSVNAGKGLLSFNLCFLLLFLLL